MRARRRGGTASSPATLGDWEGIWLSYGFTFSGLPTLPLKENLWRDTVSLLDEKQAIRVSPSDCIRDVISVMQKHRCGCVFVEADGRLVGLCTERDILKRVLASNADRSAPVSTIMTEAPVTCRRDDSIGSLIRKMVQGGYRHMPVVDPKGSTIGRVSVKEIVHYMVEYFPNAVYNLPPDPDQIQTSAEGA